MCSCDEEDHAYEGNCSDQSSSEGQHLGQIIGRSSRLPAVEDGEAVGSLHSEDCRWGVGMGWSCCRMSSCVVPGRSSSK